jgi:hypothetical protein
MEVALGSIDEQKKKKKKKKRSSGCSFPKKGRQLFVAAKMAPPLSNFLGTPLAIIYRCRAATSLVDPLL